MAERIVCPKCGAECPFDANYCARCGHDLKLSSKRGVDRLYGIISTLTPIHLVVLGLLLLTVVGSLTEYLLVSKVNFGFSVFLIALVISGGLAYLGWRFHSMESIREFALRMLIVFACMGISFLIVLLLDRVLLVLFADGTEMVFLRMPGIYIASSIGTRRVTIENAPPYWLIVLGYGIVLTVVGYFAQRLYNVILKIAY